MASPTIANTRSHSWAVRFSTDNGKIRVTLRDGHELNFDVLYPAMGCDVQSELASSLGAGTADSRQQTAVEGLYAAGDVVSDLHQLVVALPARLVPVYETCIRPAGWSEPNQESEHG